MEKLKPGLACEECLNRGFSNTLRYFYINPEEQLLKCESRYCLWPLNDEKEIDSVGDQATCDQEVATNTDDEDDFIKELLQQLGAGAEETATSCEQKPSSSPKSIPLRSPPKTLSNNDKLLSTTTTTATPTTAIFSMPNLVTASSSISNSPQKSEFNCELSTVPSSMVSNKPKELKPPLFNSAGNIEFKFSIQDLNSQKDIPKTKPNLIQAPKKASTLLQVQRKAKPIEKCEPKKKSTPEPRQGGSLSTFLDELKRQEETRKCVKQQPTRRIVASGSNAGQPRTQLVMQLLQTLEARQKKEVKLETEQEAKQMQLTKK